MATVDQITQLMDVVAKFGTTLEAVSNRLGAVEQVTSNVDLSKKIESMVNRATNNEQ